MMAHMSGLRCDECRCSSKEAPGWVAILVRDPDEDAAPEVVFFCPPCAARELEYELTVPYT
jgi:hypothetical protein